MNTNITRIIAVAIVLGIIAFLVIAFTGGKANGSTAETCVPQDATVKVIEHPAVTKVVHHDAVVINHPAVAEVTKTIPAVPEIWEVWSPNNTQGPQDYTPIWPEDSRGTWQEAADAIPGGHVGPDGVYNQSGGKGNSPWFYRQAGVAEKVVVVTPGKDAWTEVVKAAYDETVVVKDAFTETIKTDAVVCDKPTDEPTPVVPTETVTVTPEVPTETVTETPEPIRENTVPPADDPVVSKHTSSGPNKTVVTYTHESGKVTKDVRVYAGIVKEEGL